MNITEVKKDLYKTKAQAQLVKYDGTKGQLIYSIEIMGKPYEFPIDVFETIKGNSALDANNVSHEVITFIPANDLKGANFYPTEKGSFFNRWIERAIKNETIICLEKE